MFAGLGRFIKRRSKIIFDALAELSRRHPRGQVRGDGRKDVAAMKCSAEGMQKITLAGDVADFCFLPGEDHRKHAVVGRDEILPGHFREQGPPRGADARVHHHDVNGLLWKITVGLRDGEGAIGDLERLNAVADVDHLRGRRDSKNDALHHADKVVGKAEVRGERNDAPGHSPFIGTGLATVNSTGASTRSPTTTVTVACPGSVSDGTCALI